MARRVAHALDTCRYRRSPVPRLPGAGRVRGLSTSSSCLLRGGSGGNIWTPAEQFEAIVAHELTCHVERRDNLSSAIRHAGRGFIGSWFDPVVWWIQSRLIEERERACDEAVLRMGSDPEDYAQGIVTVCKFYLKSPLPCVSGSNRAPISKRRVENDYVLNRATEEGRASEASCYWLLQARWRWQRP